MLPTVPVMPRSPRPEPAPGPEVLLRLARVGKPLRPRRLEGMAYWLSLGLAQYKAYRLAWGSRGSLSTLYEQGSRYARRSDLQARVAELKAQARRS